MIASSNNTVFPLPVGAKRAAFRQKLRARRSQQTADDHVLVGSHDLRMCSADGMGRIDCTYWVDASRLDGVEDPELEHRSVDIGWE